MVSRSASDGDRRRKKKKKKKSLQGCFLIKVIPK